MGDNIPQHIKIGAINYNVFQLENLQRDQALLGQILYNQATIQLENGLSGDRKEQIFVHEVLHGCFREAGIEEQDEDIINRVSIILHQVLKDNDFSFMGNHESENLKSLFEINHLSIHHASMSNDELKKTLKEVYEISFKALNK